MYCLPHQPRLSSRSISSSGAYLLAEAEDNWGSGGNYNLALQAVTTVVLGSIAGQSADQYVVNALTPMATVLSDQFGPDNSKHPNAALDVLTTGDVNIAAVAKMCIKN
ncbi:MAG: hypothetical protein FWH15_09650 [Betaproteobacteria bacterium]|nr:hypothetical protein [Betaproteobacteria bacterium]